MLSFGTLSFTAPWLLAALAALPVLWWVLRVTPPAPKRERFAAIQFLLNAVRQEETPAHTPPWLLILRLLIAALIIAGLAGPVLNAQAPTNARGQLALIIDNGWPAAANWARIKRAALTELEHAEQSGDPVVLVRTAPAAAQSFAPMAPARARAIVQAMEPEPWRPTRTEVAQAWQAAGEGLSTERVLWLTDGISAEAEDDDDDDTAFHTLLETFSSLEIIAPNAADLPLMLSPARSTANDLRLTITRPHTQARRQGHLVALGDGGAALARRPFEFTADALSAETVFNLPNEIRNRIRRIEITGERSTGTITLLDERWQRQTLGLVSGSDLESAQPLLSDLYYIERAMAPNADLRKGQIAELIEGHISTLVLADVGQMVSTDRTLLEDWVEAGGLLIRFAGPRLANLPENDPLVPVHLRKGGRIMGGALSWAKPQTLGEFDEDSPFVGLTTKDDILVNRQVLAEPSLELAARTWARLADGTPLVTAAPFGNGHVVLFHVTANTEWSTLPLSGLFLDMLERLMTLSNTAALPTSNEAEVAGASLSPRQTLNGFGLLKAPSTMALPIPTAERGKITPGPTHPPGFYGDADAPSAFNPTRPSETIREQTEWPKGAALAHYTIEKAQRLGPTLLAIAMALALLDGLIALFLMGKLSFSRPARHAGVFLILIGCCLMLPPPAQAQDDPRVVEAALETHLAYIKTGDASLDAMSRAGLLGLTQKLIQKTAVEPAAPMGLDIETDDLTLFPLIYWPIRAEQAPLSPTAATRLSQYLKTGGMVLFDTQDQDIGTSAYGGVSGAQLALRRVLEGIDVPPLAPVPDGHVLTRSFYLLNEFPGRYAGGQVWVEAHQPDENEFTSSVEEGSTNDGVSAIIIGSNDWASAWAIDANGRPIAAVIPGGDRQRELAFRFGINLSMYALTGNYKGDQVHTKELIKRLGE